MEKLLVHYEAERTAPNLHWCIVHEKGGKKTGHKTPSLVLHPKSDTISCMSQNCFEGADIFGVIAKMENLDPKTEFKKILNIAALIGGISAESSQTNDSKSMHYSTLFPEHHRYLQERRIETETISLMNLGSLYDHILFIYKDNNGVVGYKAKTTLSKEKRDNYARKNPRWRPYYIKGEKPNVWSIGTVRDKKIIYLCAGEYDTAILHQELRKKGLDREIGAITLVTGEGTSIPQKTLERFCTLKNIEWRIVYDDDKTGHDNMPRRAQELTLTNKRISVFVWKSDMNPTKQPGYDINDYFLSTGNIDIFLDPQHFKEVVRTPEPALKDPEIDSKDDRRSTGDKLLQIALDPRVELFHTDRKEPYIRYPVKNHFENALCKSKSVKYWLSYNYWSTFKKIPDSDALNNALNVLQGRALFEGKEYPLANRVASLNNEIWFDMANESWDAIRINSTGWELVLQPPILFRRHSHQCPQVAPVSGGDPRLLFKHINNVKKEDQLLLLCVIISCFVPNIAHPVLYLYGPHGAAKTTSSKSIKMLTDPSVLETVDFPKDKKEFIQQLDHSWSLMFDNTGYISHEYSDLLCRVVSGGGFVKRELHSDDDDIIYAFKRCIGINGINLLALKPDLLERCVLVELERVLVEKRQEEQAIWNGFKADLPMIFGGVLDTLSKAMAIKPTLKMDNLPRMADFALWGCAISQALGYTPADFMTAYQRNIDMQQDVMLNESLEASLILELMKDKTEWRDTPTKLLEELKFLANEDQRRTLPTDAKVLSRKLGILTATLADAGIILERIPGRVRQIILRKQRENVASVALSLPNEGSSDLFDPSKILNTL